MNSLIELHPIFANTIPADDPNPVQCVIHDVFMESILQIDEEEAAEMLGEYSASPTKMVQSVADDDVEMTDLPSTYTEASYASVAAEVFSVTTKPIYPDEDASFDDCYEMIDTMLNEDLETIASFIKDDSSPPSPPSLVEDVSDSDESTDSDIEVPAPAPLQISSEPAPQPLTVAILPQPSGTPTPDPVRTRPRGFTNPLPAFLSSRLAPTLASPKLDTHFNLKPKKRVHFHPNTSTRSFSPASYASDFLTSMFSPISPPSPSNDIAVRRQRKNARLHGSGERGRERTRKEQGLRTYPRTCLKSFLDAQNTDCPEPCPQHTSLQSSYDTLLNRLKSMHVNFRANLSSAQISIKAPALRKAKQLHLALQEDLKDYLANNGYAGHNQEQKMSTCPDTADVETFEETAQIFGRCLEKLLLDFWTGEREGAERAVVARLGVEGAEGMDGEEEMDGLDTEVEGKGEGGSER